MKAGVQAIIQKINEDAHQHGEARCREIKNDIDVEISHENAFHLDELDKRREVLAKQNQREYGRLMERLNSRAHRELSAFERQLIDEIFDMAVDKLRAVPAETFAEMFKGATRGLRGRYTLLIGEYSEGKLDIQKIDEAIKENGKLEIVLGGESVPHKSGFILKDERVEYNCLFEDLMEDVKNERASAILKEVFRDEQCSETVGLLNPIVPEHYD